jgi:hypothetical protein
MVSLEAEEPPNVLKGILIGLLLSFVLWALIVLAINIVRSFGF